MFFPVKKIFWGLVAVVVVLMAIYTFNTLSINFLPEAFPEAYMNFFHIDREANLPAWFTSALLLSISLSAVLILCLQHELPTSQPASRTFWTVFMGMFLFLSLDESATVHELMGRWLVIPWVYLYIPFTGLFFGYCVYATRLLKLVKPQVAHLIIIGLVISAVGAMFLEFIGFQFTLVYALRQVRFVLEESGEMLGVIFILRGCLMHVNQLMDQLTRRNNTA